jgi:glycosyltransferase involved in cell wall biosynthesis
MSSKTSVRPILIAAGTSWYLWNFRRNVIAALVGEGMEVIAAAPRDDYSAKLAELPGVRWVDWPVAQNGANPFQESSSLLGYVRIVRQIRPNFVINHGIKTNIYGGLTCRLLSLPYANSVTGLGTTLARPGIGSRLLGKLYAFACNRATVLFIQNFDDLTRLRSAGVDEEVPTARTIGSGVDLADFAAAPMPRGNYRTFLFVGRLQRDKGIWEFVEAARSVCAQYPDARFIAVGSQKFANRGALPDDVLEQWKREAVVDFVGHQGDVRPWLTTGHVLVLPSHGGEGVPRAILEASAMGRPSISTDVPGCRDAVIPGKTGYLCPPQDAPALVDAMLNICRASEEELATMGRTARADAEARFSDAQLIEATISTIQRHFDRLPPSPPTPSPAQG